MPRLPARAAGAVIIIGLIASCLEYKPAEPTGPLLPNDPVTLWFLDNGRRIVNTQPVDDDADLVRFVGMVGDARLIGAGEGTHGTHEFFEMRHRLLRSLILRRAGISAFAIEGSMPDALELDRYVRDGVGDPLRALSRLYFWTWRTQEMLDL